MDTESSILQFIELATQGERRGSRRAPYHCLQRVAFGAASVAEAQFEEVYFRDLSTCGCCFVAKHPPLVSDLIVELGRRPSQIYMRAAVAHIEPTVFAGSPAFLIGCRFEGRAQQDLGAD